jgi:hypothetical protein
MFKKFVIGALLASSWAVSASAADGIRWSEGIGFYVGVDGRQTNPSGTFAGVANPNANRLTLLLDHGDHFHGIGAYSLAGTAVAPVVVPTSTNNRIPEPHSRVSPQASALQMVAGAGSMAGSWVSAASGSPTNQAYGHLGIASIQSLAGLSPEADVLLRSSADRWSGNPSGVVVGLKLDAISQGLKVSANGDADVFAGVTVLTLGALEAFSFLPTFHVDRSAAAGTYSASFSLVNLAAEGSPVLSGGQFHFDFSVPAAPVPEPATMGLLMAGLAVVASVALRRRTPA